MNANTKPVDVEEIGRQVSFRLAKIMQLAEIWRAAVNGWEDSDFNAFETLADVIEREASDAHKIINPLWGIRS